MRRVRLKAMVSVFKGQCRVAKAMPDTVQGVLSVALTVRQLRLRSAYRIGEDQNVVLPSPSELLLGLSLSLLSCLSSSSPSRRSSVPISVHTTLTFANVS